MKNINSLLAVMLIVFATSCNNNTGNGMGAAGSDSSKAPKRYIRYNVNSKDPQAIKDLQDMRIAFEKMRKMDCANPLSWYYQGAIHMVPDTVLNNHLCPSFTTSPADLKTAWSECTHDTTKNTTWNFLCWHRMYTWQLEKIVRKLSGDPKFALPYWGYCDTTDTVANRTLSAALRDTGSSIYTPARFDSLNNGYPLNGTILSFLVLNSLFQQHTFYGFSNQINIAPHGMMHNYIGQGNNYTEVIWNPIYQDSMYEGQPLGGLMINVPSAGFDPVFWLHHSNIDRLWQQWTNMPGKPKITLDDMKKYPWPYIFFDENGNKVTYSADSLNKIIYDLDYDYDDTPCPPYKGEEKKLVLMAAKPADTIVAKKIMKVISNKQAGSFSVEKTNKANTLLKANNKTEKIVTVTLRVSIEKETKASYQVFINLPKDAPHDVKGSYFAGYMNFFGAAHKMAGMNMGMGNKFYREFVFDLTDEFKATNALDKSKFDFTIIGGKPTDPPVTIEDVTFTVE